MPEPTGAILLALAKVVGPAAARQVWAWWQGSEAQQLVKLLKKDHPAAPKMSTQPEVLGLLWKYVMSGQLDHQALVTELCAITNDKAEAEALANAIRDEQWRVVRDDRRVHFDLQRLQAEQRAERAQENEETRQWIFEVLDDLSQRLPAARQLPAETSEFVDRENELQAGDAALTTVIDGITSARVICIRGMPGSGKSTFALRLAHAHAGDFAGDVLYVDMRRPDGSLLPFDQVADRLLRELGVDSDSFPARGAGRPALLRSVLADQPALLLLDNAGVDAEIAQLIPANPECVVVLTTTQGAFDHQAAWTVLDLGQLGEDDALELLQIFAGERVEREPEAARTIVAACDGLPLALVVAGARLRRRPTQSLADLVKRLERFGALTGLDDPNHTIGAALTTGLADLEAGARRLMLLAAALEVIEIDIGVAVTLLDVAEPEAAGTLERLEDARLLLPLSGGGYRMHALMREVAAGLAREELTEDEVMSAHERKVSSLVESAKQRTDDLSDTE